MQIESLLLELRTELINLKDHVTAAGKSQLYNTHILAERVVLPIFQKIWGYQQMRNLNDQDRDNYPAIDLADDTVGVAVQISGTETLNKVKSMLTTFLDHDLQSQFDSVFLYVLTEKQSSYSQDAIDNVTQGRLQFSGKKHVLDFTDVCKKAKSASPEAVRECIATLRSYLRSVDPARRPTWLLHVQKSAVDQPPFTPAWFLYTERQISLFGREAELALLRDFVHSGSKFSWWAVTGPAGIGKSRIAHELASILAPDWDAGFANSDTVPSTDTLREVDKPTLIVIDYAARDAQRVRAILASCAANAIHFSHNVRVLLLERESGQGVEWWESLMKANSQFPLIYQTLFGTPLRLKPLTAKTVQIMTAWLEAGAPSVLSKLPLSGEKYWHDLDESTEGRPLLVGFAAAAFSRAPDNPSPHSLKDMLQAELERELDRWHERCISPEQFDAVVRINCLGTLLRGLPLLAAEDTVVLVRNKKEVLMRKDAATGRYHLPTVEWLEQNGRLPEVMRTRNDTIFEILRSLVRPDLLPNALTVARQLCPQRWTLQPDLLGEFFLEELWSDPPYFVHSRKTPAFPNDALDLLLACAWRASPSSCVSTLDDLRHTVSSPSTFRRVLTHLATVASRDESSEPSARDTLVSLLFNSTLNVGRNKTSEADRKGFIEAIRRLHEGFPTDARIAYRYLKTRIQQLPQYSDLDAALTERIGLLRDGRALLMRSDDMQLEPYFYLSLADQLQVAATLAWTRQDEELLKEVLAAAQLLQNRFAQDPALRTTLISFYSELAKAVAGLLSEPNINDPSSCALMEKVLPAAEASILALIDLQNTFDNTSWASLAWALLNLSMSQSLLGRSADVNALEVRITQATPWLPREKRRRIKLQYLYNLHTVWIRESNLSEAKSVLNLARNRLTSDLDQVEASAYLAMIKQGAAAYAAVNDWENFGKYCEAFISCIRHIPDEAGTHQLLASTLGTLLDPQHPIKSRQRTLALLGTVTGGKRRSKAAVALCCVAVALSTLQKTNDHKHGLKALKRVLQLAREFPNSSVFHEITVSACLDYWVRHTDQRDGRIDSDFEMTWIPPDALALTVFTAAGTPLLRTRIPVETQPPSLLEMSPETF